MKVKHPVTFHLSMTHVYPAEDELHNIDMAEVEKDKKKQELKIKRRDYTGYDDDEFAEGNQGLMKRSILAKYDEELEGPKSSVCQCSLLPSTY